MATPEAHPPQLRPLSLGEILDVSIKICIAHWKTLLKAVLVVVVPVQIVSTFLTADYTVSSFDFSTDSSQTPQEALEEINQYLGGLAISTLLQVLALLLATAACFRAIAQAYLGAPTDWRSSLSFAFKQTPSLLWLTVLYVLGVLLGFVLFIAPGIWLYVAWAFALPVLLVEGARGPKALGRSYQLVKGRWWRTCGVLLVGFILASIVSTVVQGAFIVGIFVTDNDVLVLVLSAIAGILGLAVSTPFQAALLTVVYFDLRVRKEGFDLELLAQGIGGSVPATAGGFARTEPSAPAPPPPPVPAGSDAPASGATLWPAPAAGDPPPAEAPGPAHAQDWPPPPPAPSAPPPPPGWTPPRERPDGSDDGDSGSGDEPPDAPPRLPGVPYG